MKMKVLASRAMWRGVGRGVLGAAGLALLIGWSGGCFGQKLAPGTVAVESGVAVPEGAATFAVIRAPFAPRIDVVGTVESTEKIHLSARLSAYVREVNVTAGNPVNKDQVLIALDDRELREQLVAAEARLEQARVEYDRARKLIEANATTDQALTAARAAFDGATSQVKQMRVLLTFTEIRSPLNGRVADRRIEVGDLANPGQPLLTVYDPTRMRIEVPVPVRLVSRLQAGQAVDVSLDRPARPFKGVVSEVVGEIDPLSRTQRVKVGLEDVRGEVLPGTFGRVWVQDEPRDAILIPAEAVFYAGQITMVQVVRDGRAVRRIVRTGATVEGRVEILAGLENGETVLAAPVRG